MTHTGFKSSLWLFLVVTNFAIAFDGGPVAVEPAGPAPEADPVFSWMPLDGAVAYRLNVRNAANKAVFNQWYSAAEAGCANGEAICSISIGTGFLPASYRWRVIARDQSGLKSDWSEWRTFFPAQDDVPGSPPSPQAVGPEGQDDTNRPVFTWWPSLDGSRFRIKVVDSGNRRYFNRWRSAAGAGCSDGLGPCELESPVIFEPGEYRWKVLARNRLTGVNSEWSPWMTFTVPAPQNLGSGLDARPVNLTCTLPEGPPRVSGVGFERIFSGVALNDAVILLDGPAGLPGDERWFAVQRDGTVVAWDASDPQANVLETILDISDRTVADTGETGLLGMAFHPQYPDDNRAFLFYTNLVDGEYESYLSEFQTLDDGDSLDAASERKLLTLTGHATHNHKGGTVLFGPDGYLYLAVGDGGNALESQNPFSLFGTMIRIDIDQGDPYAIPATNPFADGLYGAPEVYAYGFRNPWRWSFDEFGFLWLTDVGLSSWEEINIVQPGANYGWPIYEGPECRRAAECDTEGLTPPFHAYPHDSTGGIVVVGGYVYRGEAFPDLRGKFVYADGTDRVWALLYDELGNPDPEILIDGGLPGSLIRSIFEDDSGELYLLKGGQVFRLVASDGPTTGFEFPELLSDTGCVDPDRPTEPADGLVPYDVNTAFWTDGADKTRWIALPDNEFIEIDETGDFRFPPGSVLVKEFRLFDRRIETRLFARHDDGEWAGYTYAWNEDETEATLVEPEGRQIEVEGQVYSIPSRQQCLFCHSEAAGRSLGLETLQLNGDFHYASTGRNANQLTTLEAIGALRHALPERPENLAALTPLDAHSASFELRARSYLHSNCSMCHRPGGPGRGPADLRYQPLEFMNICDILPTVSDLGIEDARLLAPGAPERSIIAVRQALLGPGAMPPVGKNVVDINAAAVIQEYISGLESCP